MCIPPFLFYGLLVCLCCLNPAQKSRADAWAFSLQITVKLYQFLGVADFREDAFAAVHADFAEFVPEVLIGEFDKLPLSGGVCVFVRDEGEACCGLFPQLALYHVRVSRRGNEANPFETVIVRVYLQRKVKEFLFSGQSVGVELPAVHDACLLCHVAHLSKMGFGCRSPAQGFPSCYLPRLSL